ncbi:MAG: endolytic transglycosylase MltG [Candidatus Peribacteraceae bacterium]|nr:endolytic transglycosylase MltG [Candidatus Peribacteraceae bacterium]
MCKSRAKSYIILAVVVALFIFGISSCFRKASAEDIQIFTVSRNASSADVKEKLAKQDFMAGRWFFGPALLLHGGYWRVQSGGYKIDPAMSSWALAGVLTSDPQLKWVVIPEGLRREQVADRLATALNWKPETREEFLTAAIATPYDLTDGFYFPDTYLIPVAEEPATVAKRFVNRFNDTFDPYVKKFRDANIKADTAIKLASIIQREAGGKTDKPLIAGILWNRLLIKMPLEVDATLQYARGDTGSGYWAPISVADKKIDSPFNTYKNAGLPPQPIANPGIDSIDAVLNSTDTPCIFYLHDNNRQIHCSETYDGHLQNIETYLRNQ